MTARDRRICVGLDGAQWPWSSRPAGLRAVLIRSQDWSVIRSYRDHGRAADGPRTVSFPRPIDCTLRGGPGESGPAEAAADSPGGIAGSCGRHAFAPGEHHDHFPKISRSLERLASKPSPEFLKAHDLLGLPFPIQDLALPRALSGRRWMWLSGRCRRRFWRRGSS